MTGAALPTLEPGFTLPGPSDLKKMQEEFAKERIGIVYFLTVEDTEVVKIGFASDLHQRVGALQTGNHKEIRAYFAIRTVPHAEQVFHNLLKDHRVRLEWFYHEDEVEELIECLQDIELANLHLVGDAEEFVFTPEHIIQVAYDWSTSYDREAFGGRDEHP